MKSLKKKRDPNGRNDSLLYVLILVYIGLWLSEGGLRRWILPQLSNPLLLVRDPVAIAIYGVAAYSRRFPQNPFVTAAWILGILEIGFAALGHANWKVALYGLRCDFLHIPMIFIISKSLTVKRFEKLCRFAVLLTLPYTLLLIIQFYSPQSYWVNRGLGGDLEGAGFSGALGKFRPPGAFSFNSGVANLYTIFTACLFATWSKRLQPLYISAFAAASIAVAIPISISRTLFLSVLIVFATGLLSAMIDGKFRLRPEYVFVMIALILIVPVGIQLPFIQDGVDAFSERWTVSTTDNGGVSEAIGQRFLEGMFGVFFDPNLVVFGVGTGFSTNAGQKMLSGEIGFGMSEGEVGRLVYDNGILLGPILVLFRYALTLWVGAIATSAFLRGNSAGLVFFAAACLPLLIGQWGQPTSQGAATIAAGLTLAASRRQRDLSKAKGERDLASISSSK